MKKLLLILSIFCGCVFIAGTLFVTKKAEHKKAVFIYVHGLGERAKHWNKFEPIMPGTVVSFDFSEGTQETGTMWGKDISFGQENEISRLNTVCERAHKDYPDSKIVLVGNCRGANVVLNFLAIEKPSYINVAVLESPFYSFKDVIDSQLMKRKLGKSSIARSVGSFLFRLGFPSCKINGISPQKVLHDIPESIPLLIVYRDNDPVVPTFSTERIVNAARYHKKKAYALSLQEGNHGKLMRGPQADIYISVAHAFYQHYTIAHDVKLAIEGEKLFKQICPLI